MQVDHVDNRTTQHIQTLRTQVRDLVRAVGRGSTALRDESNNVLTLNPSADHPLLTAQAQDVALAFKDGQFHVTDATGTQDRTLSAGALTADTVTANGAFQGTDINLSGALVGNKLSTAGGFLDSVQFAIGANPIFCGHLAATDADLRGGSGLLFAGTINCGQINMASNPIFCGDVHGINGIFLGTVTQSDARLKHEFHELGEDVLDGLLEAPVRRWRWRERWQTDPETGERLKLHDDREHIGPVAQDVPEELRVELDDGHLGIDGGSLAGALLALVQRQAQQIAELTARVQALEECRAAQSAPAR